MSTLAIWKFILGEDEVVQDPDDPARAWSACVAVAVAHSKEEAIEVLKAYARDEGHPQTAGFLRVARVVKIPIKADTVVAWVELPGPVGPMG